MSGVSEHYNLLDPDEADKGITAAMAALRAGELIVIPTDTVYGVAAEAFDQRAVTRLLQAKDRGRDVPPPVLIGTAYAMEGLADGIDDTALALADKFWPGGLSLVFKQQPSLTWDLGENKGTVMLRMPDQDQVLQLLRRTGPLAVSSANRHGRPAPTSVEVAEAELGERVSVYLDGGETPGPVPSTIVDLTRVIPQVLRRGVVTVEQLREVVGAVEIDIEGEDIEYDPEVLARLDEQFDQIDVDEPAESIEPVESVDSIEPVKSVESVEPVESVESDGASRATRDDGSPRTSRRPSPGTTPRRPGPTARTTRLTWTIDPSREHRRCVSTCWCSRSRPLSPTSAPDSPAGSRCASARSPRSGIATSTSCRCPGWVASRSCWASPPRSCSRSTCRS